MVSVSVKMQPPAVVLKSDNVTPVTGSANVNPKLGDTKLVAEVVVKTGSAAVRLITTAVVTAATAGPALVAASLSELAERVKITDAASAQPEIVTV